MIVQTRFRLEAWFVVPEDNMNTFHTITVWIKLKG